MVVLLMIVLDDNVPSLKTVSVQFTAMNLHSDICNDGE